MVNWCHQWSTDALSLIGQHNLVFLLLYQTFCDSSVAFFAALTLWVGGGSKEDSTEETMAAEAEKVETVSEAEHMTHEAKLKAEEMAAKAKEEAEAASKNLQNN